MPSARRLLIVVVTVLVLGVAVLDLLSVVGWPETGPVAIAGVLAAHLTIVAFVVGIPIALLAGTGALRVGLVALVLLSVLRFGGDWFSLPDGTPSTTPRLDVATWNLEVGGRPAPDTVEGLRSLPGDVVALQELTPDVAAAIAGDLALAHRFPYQSLHPRVDVLGLGILSRYPLSGAEFEIGPARLSTVADTPIGRIRIANVHPLHGLIARVGTTLPVDYTVADRNDALTRLRGMFVDDGVAMPTMILGDINTASTEPAFGRFTAGLRDAHAEVGLGPGWTYRPDALEPLGIGLLRIDVVLASPGLRPTAETTVCPPLGDHCAVTASLVADPGR